MHRPCLRRVIAVIAVSAALSCQQNPVGSNDGLLAIGRWTGEGACLSVVEAACNLVVGCGHGQFPRPTVRPDGTFDVDGTYRIEVGPVSIQPAPPAHFSGSLSSSRLTLTVVPTADGLPAATYSVTLAGSGMCAVRCL